MTCPNCGYCPHCGRGGHHFQPPYVPYQPVWISQPNTAGGMIGSGFGTGTITQQSPAQKLMEYQTQLQGANHL